MNKYIKKCLLVYVSMAIILCGMVGVTYAITATDADQYITRSQYAVDMAHLQNKLDEVEAGLMGSINRYRSTDVKFVTFDTPNKYYASTAWSGGYYNGGNYGARPKLAGATYCYTGVGIANTNANPLKQEGRYADYSLFRIYNGNYYITKNLHMNNRASSPVLHYQTLNYAVPVENFSGWYLIIRLNYHYGSYINSAVSLVKLDPNATSVPSQYDTLQIRFKKDLFKYCGDSASRLTTTKRSSSFTSDYYRNNDNSPFGFRWRSDQTRFSYDTLYTDSWVDEATGDYMMTLRGIRCCTVDSTGGLLNSTYYYSGGTTSTLQILVPADNVEYISGNTIGRYALSETQTTTLIPVAGYIGTGYGSDPCWQYEFVDCDNGIKFWHAYHAPELTQHSGYSPVPVGTHYSLPIVY